MPIIQVELTHQSKEKKGNIEKLIQTMIEVTHIPAQAFTVIINEHEPEDIGVAGVPLSERHS